MMFVYRGRHFRKKEKRSIPWRVLVKRVLAWLSLRFGRHARWLRILRARFG